ncbi:Cupin-2 domain-containing protein [Fusarium keratoplasticum]|uniref:Cupin-2 domain-containing protein n=1 Tax=Fusarium keratoplasticum TaxID=1328300 RepID=A0ACC0RAK1_9HYPO|nr:Cupin-2 domain-containing protein [Fusarium keratoplasticum]KAI8679546.1 Cupin-2 domain-containing protein [Fusarium keratoplasticum]
MDSATEAYAETLRINHFKPEEVPWRRLGQYLWRPIEDGSNTQYRLAVIESLLPPKSDGPVFHFHEMHDEGFYKGTVRFHSPGRPDVDCKAGEMLTIPIRLPHKFSNPFDEEAVFINTATPGFFIRYFEHLEALIGSGKELTPEANIAALRRFATIPLSEEEVNRLEEIAAAKKEVQDKE